MAFPISNLLARVKSGLWQKESASVVGIDVGSSAVKAVQIKKQGGRAVLETYGELFLGPYGDAAIGQAVVLPPEKLVEAITDLFREANISAKIAAFSVPLSASLVTLVDIPAPPGAKMDEVIALEARKYVPVPINEVTLDWWIIPKREFDTALPPVDGKPLPTPHVEVLLAAIHNTVVEKYTRVAGDLSTEASAFEIESFSVARAVAGNDLAPTLILDIGASTSKITIVDYGVVRVAHTINKGSQEITLALSRSQGIDFEKAEEMKRSQGMRAAEMPVAMAVMDYILFEANRAALAYQKKYSRALSRAILLGGGSLLPSIPAKASKLWGIEAALGRPFEKLATPAFLESLLTESGPEFAAAVGLALRRLQELE